MSNIFWSNIFRSGDDELDTITRLWQSTPLFKGIPNRHSEMLCSKMHPRLFKQDETIFTLGDQGAGVILVLEGSVKIMAKRTQLALLEVGDFFGEIALASTEKRTADAYAVTDSKLVFFLKQDLEEWIELEPRLGARFLMNLSAILAQRLYQANKLIATQS
ncbi:MAG: CRP/FNR family cyclic AMP-dependent transcriptional regulator [Planctomycetota bacterium]|jgi:CRP/FNR family cyclic AMP-dependent transcriptional regulator